MAWSPTMTLTDEIAEAEAKLALLKLKKEHATCAEAGCDMRSVGGANCGCEFEVEGLHGEKTTVSGCCSVPVNTCARCGDSDYGDNAEAKEVRRLCAEKDER